MPMIGSIAALTIAALLGVSSEGSSLASQSSLVTDRIYWNTTLSDFAIISVCIDTAAMAAVDGDLIRAARVLGYGEKYADRLTAALHQIPAGWRNRVEAHLTRAKVAFAAADNALRFYLAHGKVTDLKAAQGDESRASAELVAATTEAQRGYASAGGNPADLETVSQAMRRANATLAATMGDTDTDDQ
jgi:hypothetical protein